MINKGIWGHSQNPFLKMSIERNLFLMEDLKINEQAPLTISCEEMKTIAKKIVDMKLDWFYESGDDYWLITISPSGKIILPNNETAGHPQMAKKLIYPNDKILQLLYKYFENEELNMKTTDNDIKMAYFMIMYGYFNIDGYMEYEKSTQCMYNPLALTAHTRALPNSLLNYCKIITTIDQNYAGLTEMELSKKIPFFRKRILKLLEVNKLNENEVEQLMAKRSQTEKQFLDEINTEYENYRKEHLEKEHI